MARKFLGNKGIGTSLADPATPHRGRSLDPTRAPHFDALDEIAQQ
jgi:hypothetical protein